MIIYIAPWSNDPPRESGSSSFPVPLLPSFVRVTHGCSVGQWYYCPAIQVHPYLSVKKGEFLLAVNEFAKESEKTASSTRWGSVGEPHG